MTVLLQQKALTLTEFNAQLDFTIDQSAELHPT